MENDKVFFNKTYRIGSRDSQLALVQSNWVKNELEKVLPGIRFEIIKMKTVGDTILHKSLSKTGEKNLFTKELEDALLKKQVDMVVNSLKDMPSTLPEGLTISAISKRECPLDVVVMHPKNQEKKLCDLKPASIIGTSSLRRVAQLSRAYPQFKFKSIRGNLNTRLNKLHNSNELECIILAYAGLKRLSMLHYVSQILSPSECLYAIGQGSLAIETRARDYEVITMVSRLHCKETVLRTVAERAFLSTLGGGCSVPQGVHSWFEDDKLCLTGGAFNFDGSKAVIETRKETISLSEESGWQDQSDLDKCRESSSITTSHRFMHPLQLKIAGHLGRDVAIALLRNGAAVILDEAKQTNLKTQDIPI